MARLPRLTVAHLPHHVIWRGLEGRRVCVDDEDRHWLKQTIAVQAKQHQVALHAYLLLDQEIQCLCTPERTGALGSMMQGIARSYVPYFNIRHQRQGTMWEGRYRCTVVEPGEGELQVMTLIDTEPVHAGLVPTSDRYPWSSHAHYLGRRIEKELTAPAAYWQLGNTPFAREAVYAQRTALDLTIDQRKRLRDAALTGWVLGSEEFIEAVQTLVGRRVVKGRAGRPKRLPPAPSIDVPPIK